MPTIAKVHGYINTKFNNAFTQYLAGQSVGHDRHDTLASRYRQLKMNLSQEHIDFESKCRSIIGQTLKEVEYLEIDYQQSETPFFKTKFSDIDSIDFSLVFHTDNGSLEFYWDGQFYQYGIGLKINEPSVFSDYKKWRMTDNLPWKKIIEHQIKSVDLTWEKVTTKEEKSSKTYIFIYPQNIRIDFDNNKSIFISAAGFLNEEDNEVYGMLDNLTVTDNEELARKVKMIN